MQSDIASDEAQQPSYDDASRQVLDSIRRLVQRLRQSANVSEKRFGLSAAQVFVLHKLRDAESLSVGELAARTLTSQSSVSEVVQKLVQAGHVARTRSTRDARSVELSLTDAGRSLIGKTPVAPQDFILGGLKRMPPRERRQLARLLSRLVKETGMVNSAAPMFFEDSPEESPDAQALPTPSDVDLADPLTASIEAPSIEEPTNNHSAPDDNLPDAME